MCGERTGSVAILRIAPRRFCFRFRCPRSFSAPALTPVRPPPLCPFVSSGSLSLVLLSSGAHSYVKFGTARQRGVMYDLTGCDAFLSCFLSLSLSFSLHKASESGKIAVCELAHSSSPHSAYSNVRHCSLIGGWLVDLQPFSLRALYLSTVSFKFYPTMLHVFHGFTVRTVLADGSSRHSEKRKHALGTRGSGLRQVNGIIPYFSIKRGK